MDALDFRIEVSGGATQGYEVMLRGPDGGEVSRPLQLSRSALEVLAARVPDAVIASSARVRRAMSAEERPVRQLGAMLFDAVLAGQGRGMFAACRHQADREGQALRVVLQVRPPELARLPWEFLFDSAEDDYVGLSAALVRCPVVSAGMRPLRVAGPLRVLGMAARPGDQQELAVAAEWHRLGEALGPLVQAGRVELEWVAGQSWRDLRAKVRQGGWHVLHFIGHGGFDAAAEEGTLALAAEDGAGTYWLGAEALATMLRGDPSLRLVVLNACETGRHGALDGFSSVAGALIRRGVPSVLAMQHEITDQAALEFSRAFYEELAHQPLVERCVTRARQAIQLALPGSLEWGTPVLYMRSPDGILFDLASGHASAPAREAAAARPADTTTAGSAPGREAAGLEDLYTEGLDALYTERWDEAVQVFTSLTAVGGGFMDSADKLNQARRGQRLATLYAAGNAAADGGRWEEAARHLTAVVAAEPGYRDAQELLERARRAGEVARLRAEAAALHRAGKWQAVLAVGERLAALASDAPDPDGLVASARAELRAERRARDLAAAHQRALRHLDAGEWDEAGAELTAILDAEPDYLGARELLEYARWGGEVARLRAEAAALHRAGKWQAVLAVGERLAALAPDAPDPDGLVASAQAELRAKKRAERRARDLAKAYQRAVRHIDAGEWDEAGVELTAIQEGEPGYQDIEQLTERVNRERARAAEASQHPASQATIPIGTAVHAIAFSPDGSRLAVACARRRVLIVDLTGRVKSRPRSWRWTSEARDVAFDPSGRLMATAAFDGARVRDASTGTELLRITHGYHTMMNSVAFGPGGRLLATAGYEGAARVWDAGTGAQLLEVTHSGSAVEGVAFSPDGRLLATASHDKTARVWDASTGSQLLEITHGNDVTGVAFSPDGRLLATAGLDNARVWDMSTGRHLLYLDPAHVSADQPFTFIPGGANGVAFSPDGRLLATAGQDQTVRLWQLPEEPQ